jgi:hypothetical protein
LIISAIGGIAVGVQIMIAVYEDQRGRGQRRAQPHHAARLKLVRAASGA